jgi:predicted nicotinamide N-methyase
MDLADKTAFIIANTAVMAPPHVPEIRLRLADEAHDLWYRTQQELEDIGLPPPYWAFAWAGGQGLARYILDNPGVVSGRTVLDFASGSGIVAIAAAMAGAARVAASDIDPFCGPAIALNAELNDVAVEFREADLVGAPLEEKVVLAGDVFFDFPMSRTVEPWLRGLAGNGATVLIGDPDRAYLPRRTLVQLAEYEVPVTRALEDAEVKRTRVWRFA